MAIYLAKEIVASPRIFSIIPPEHDMSIPLLISGEVCETFNAFARPHAHRTAYMNVYNRAEALEALAQRYNESKGHWPSGP